MAKIMDFLTRKKSSSEVTDVGGTTQGESTVVGSKTRLLDLNRRLPNFSNFGGQIPYEGAIPYVLLFLLATMAADLTSMGLRTSMVPSAAPPAKKQNAEPIPYRARTDYDNVIARNIFNSDGFIPEVQVARNPELDTNTARQTSLPLVLIGTIVHANPGKSVATIQANGNAEKVLPYIPNDDIEGMATLIKVDRKKAFIRNLNSGSLEYIQIKEEGGLVFQKKPSVGSKDGPIEKEGDNTFAISRGDLENQMSNLPELLTQARAVPNLVPGGNGKIDGFRILDVVDGSLYTKLGIQTGDVIKSVDGEPVDSPAKAMELYNSLRSKNQVQITMERNGKTTTMTYNIR